MNLKAMAVVAGAVVASTASGDAVQWRVEDGGNGHWYRFNSSHVDWQSARAAALEQGGDLACITTSGENAFVRNLIPPGDAGYLGGIRVPDGSEVPWRWVSGESWSYVKWNPGEPNGNTAGEVIWLERDSGGWNDHTQDFDIQGALIEWSADCNNDGIVDYGQCRDGTLPDYNSNNVPDCCEQGMACAVADYPMQWRTEDGGNGHWYSKSIWTSPKNWIDARASATARGADLVAISAAAENTWIVTRFDLSHDPCAGYRGWFIGAYQDLLASDYSEPNGGWRWSNGESWGWTNWRPGAPDNYLGNQHWALIDTPIEGQAWDDVGGGPGGPEPICRAIFEWSADCNSDGVVDFGQILGGELADVDGNGVPDDCECVADLDGDGVVASEDLAAVLNNWGTKGGVIDADVNNDGIVDGSDLSIVLNGWGTCP
ncbi:MAG: hypothetical protein RIT24_111 [Planctomycetota bacterium]